MAQVHPDARMQLITGDSAPLQVEDLFAYNLFRSGRGMIVCREAPLFPTIGSPSETARKVVLLSDPATSPDDEQMVPRSRWERFLLEPGLPWCTIRGKVFDRTLLAAVWGRILPMGIQGPHFRLIEVGKGGGVVLSLQDRRGLAAAVFPSLKVDPGQDPLPSLRVDG